MTEASTGLALQDVAGRPGASIAAAIEAAVDDGRLGTLERLAVLGLLASLAALLLVVRSFVSNPSNRSSVASAGCVTYFGVTPSLVVPAPPSQP